MRRQEISEPLREGRWSLAQFGLDHSAPMAGKLVIDTGNPYRRAEDRGWSGARWKVNWETDMTIASDLLQQHIQTLVNDNAQWQTLIADDLVWELVYASAIGHPARLSGRQEVVRHVTWFLGAVENFRFFDVKVYPFADPEAAVAEFKAEGLRRHSKLNGIQTGSSRLQTRTASRTRL